MRYINLNYELLSGYDTKQIMTNTLINIYRPYQLPSGGLVVKIRQLHFCGVYFD